MLVSAYSLGWHAQRQTQFRGSRSGRQANRRMAMTGRLGRFYFGAVLGMGICTYMTTPLVYALLAYAMVAHLPAAALAGLGFGMGRARPLLDGMFAATQLSPLAAADRFAGLTRGDHALGCALAVLLIAGTLVIQS